MTAPRSSPWLTPPAVADQLAVGVHRVLAWIHAGELKAVDLSAHRRQRPRYRIAPEALQQFLQSREVQPPTPRARRRRQATDCPQYV